jgi:probable addiction module antidote protein
MNKTKIDTAAFDVADYLDDESTIAAYLSEMIASGDVDLLLSAIKDVARARGMAQIAKDAGVGRESLYKSLEAGSKPRFETVAKIVQAMGLKLSVSPA